MLSSTDIIVIALIARLFRAIAQRPSNDFDDSLAHRLMEHAGERAGTRGSEARELRRAAVAYLRVVR